VILGDSLGYQGINAKSAKETLQQRSLALEEHQAAVKTTISKRRQIERLKASSNIRPEKVDEAVEELKEAAQIEEILTKRVQGISENLHKAIITHSRHTHEDVTSGLIEHARTTLIYERTILKELEAVRNDVRTIGQPRSALSPTITPQQSPVSPLPAASPRAPALQYAQSESSPKIVDPHFQQEASRQTNQAVSVQPGSLPTTPRPLNGSKSMIITPSRPQGGPLDSVTVSPAQSHRNPKGSVNMARSMFIQPQRGRIDEREAARKLANFL